MKRCKMNNKGSTSVFLMLILTFMMGLTAMFIYATEKIAIKSQCDGILVLAGKSVLSEFDLDLKKDYGLLAFQGQGKEVTEKMKMYLLYTFQLNPKIQMTQLGLELGQYSIQNPEHMKTQILEYMKSSLLTREKHSVSETEKERDRTLRNQQIIFSLPSYQMGKAPVSFLDQIGDWKDKLTSINDVLIQGTDTYLINQYILIHFKNFMDQGMKGETFFSNEVEYILEGDYSNRENKKKTENTIIALRTALNTTHLYADPQKRTEILLMAQSITPGPAAIATQAVIAGAWALGEAKNDMELLDQGKKVPLIKDKMTWALDLKGVLNNQIKGCIDTGQDRGLTYEGYLEVLLFFQNETIKLVRVMDLIQINMKGRHNGKFLIQEYNRGFAFSANINRNRYDYEEFY